MFGICIFRQFVLCLRLMITKTKKQKIVQDFQVHQTDSGSAQVQIALLTQRMKELASHLHKNPKDNHSRRGLLKMVNQRRRLLKYLHRSDAKAYNSITRKLVIKKFKKIAEPAEVKVEIKRKLIKPKKEKTVKK